MDEMQSHLMRCFLAVFPELDESAVCTATPSSVERWDSVATINLITVIEEEFGVQIDFVDVMDNLSYEKISAHLRERIQAGDQKYLA